VLKGFQYHLQATANKALKAFIPSNAGQGTPKVIRMVNPMAVLLSGQPVALAGMTAKRMPG